MQDNILHEETLKAAISRNELMPVWVQLFAGVLTFSGFSLAVFMMVPLSGQTKDVPTFTIITAAILGVIFVIGGVAGIQLLKEKKWAIFGMIGSVVFHLFICIVSLFVFPAIIGRGGEILIVPVVIIMILLLVFLVKLILIFKRWLEYQPSGMRKR